MTIDILNINSPEWMNRGLCSGRPDEDTQWGRREYGRRVDERWMPDGEKLEERLKANCNGCPVKRACFRYALEHAELEGVWGGTTLAERRELRRRSRKAA